MAKKVKDWIKQPLALGLGLMDLTRERLHKMVKEVQKDISEKDKKKAVDQMFKYAQSTRKQAEDMMRKQVKWVIDELGLATKADLKKRRK